MKANSINNPNARVWRIGNDYVESAELLLQNHRVHSAAVLSCLAIEILLKSLSTSRSDKGYTQTKSGHKLLELYEFIDEGLQQKLLIQLREINSNINLLENLVKFSDVFTGARYWYEKTSIQSVGSDCVYFSRHLSNAILLLGQKVEGDAKITKHKTLKEV